MMNNVQVLRNFVSKQVEAPPLPPANVRVYIHEGKPAPKGVKVYDAGDFKGGHEGVQFWLGTDDKAEKR